MQTKERALKSPLPAPPFGGKTCQLGSLPRTSVARLIMNKAQIPSHAAWLMEVLWDLTLGRFTSQRRLIIKYYQKRHNVQIIKANTPNPMCTLLHTLWWHATKTIGGIIPALGRGRVDWTTTCAKHTASWRTCNARQHVTSRLPVPSLPRGLTLSAILWVPRYDDPASVHHNQVPAPLPLLRAKDNSSNLTSGPEHSKPQDKRAPPLTQLPPKSVILNPPPAVIL